MASLWQLSLALLLSTLSGVAASDARIASMAEAPKWQLNSLMHLQLTVPEAAAVPLTYNVYPLTLVAGLNKTDRSGIRIRGSLVSAGDSDNSELLKDPRTIAFLCCDADNATAQVNNLMNAMPKAILLYSINGNCCRLEARNLTYNPIYTMGDSWEAQDTVKNTVRAGGVLRATITGDGNVTTTPTPSQDQNGSTSAVAMSILYSITGLITLLFLVIIATGAIRAHRYPERYGPRSGLGGRPRQSRAKGLARAVLETLPIVKFGDPNSAKPDPAIELESQRSGPSPEPGLGTRLSAIPEEPQAAQSPPTGAPPPMSGAASQPDAAPATGLSSSASDNHLGCSICTDDFTVGEDVRVLPCDHKFHPACIDPWLINVSGTCPLCRLDLRPHDQQAPGSRGSSNGSADPDDPFHSAPPLNAAENWTAEHGTTSPSTSTASGTHINTRRRSSRLLGLDLHRLRHASVEERIEILRRHRSHQQQQQQEQQEQQQPESATTAAGAGSGSGSGSGAGAGAVAATEEAAAAGAAEHHHHHRSGLAERLRERFRIRTTRTTTTMRTAAAAAAAAMEVGGAASSGSGSSEAAAVAGAAGSGSATSASATAATSTGAAGDDRGMGESPSAATAAQAEGGGHREQAP